MRGWQVRTLVAIVLSLGVVTVRLFPLFGERTSGPIDLHGCKRKLSKVESLAGNEKFTISRLVDPPHSLSYHLPALTHCSFFGLLLFRS
jgi:hypothetical protein